MLLKANGIILDFIAEHLQASEVSTETLATQVNGQSAAGTNSEAPK